MRGGTDRQGTRRRRREKGRSPKGARRVRAQERGVRPTARRTLDQSDGRGAGRTSAAPRQSAEGRQLSVQNGRNVRNEEQNLHQAISRRTQQEVFAIARRRVTDLATTSLEERISEVFTRRLREIDGQEKASLPEALKTASDPAVVRSAFDLPAEQHTAIQNAINETFSAEIHVRFGPQQT